MKILNKIFKALKAPSALIMSFSIILTLALVAGVIVTFVVDMGDIAYISYVLYALSALSLSYALRE